MESPSKSGLKIHKKPKISPATQRKFLLFSVTMVFVAKKRDSLRKKHHQISIFQGPGTCSK
jgi:hypothetical protein